MHLVTGLSDVTSNLHSNFEVKKSKVKVSGVEKARAEYRVVHWGYVHKLSAVFHSLYRLVNKWWFLTTVEIDGTRSAFCCFEAESHLNCPTDLMDGQHDGLLLSGSPPILYIYSHIIFCSWPINSAAASRKLAGLCPALRHSFISDHSCFGVLQPTSSTGQWSFYRAMLCIARTMLSQDVRLSVRLSVHHTPVFCWNGQTYPQTIFTTG